MTIKHNRLTGYLANRYYDVRTRDLKKVIFTATTGRSGTATLQKIFETIPCCKSVHEPYPIMNDAVLKAASSGDQKYVTDFYWRRKSVNIRRAAIGNSYYLEANHLFIKTFISEAVRDFGSRVAVIHLVRDPVDVAKSLYQLGDFAAETRTAWWLDHRASSNRIPIADILDCDAEFSHLFYKGLWYWFEIEARIAEWRKRLPEVQFIRFETEWFNEKKKICELLEKLGVEYQEALLEVVVGARENTRVELKESDDIAADRAKLMLKLFKEMLRTNNVFPHEVAVCSSEISG
ncbi:MAG: sulfotransferase domain-containing protein [Gammaproteobacteria bacterium]